MGCDTMVALAPATRAGVTLFAKNYIDDSVPPAPLFIYNSWVDDLFPGDEALRFWRKTVARHPDAEIALQLAAGFGHPRAFLGDVESLRRVGQRVDEFFARHLKGEAVPPPPPFETYTQSCDGSPVLGPFTGASWDALRPGEGSQRVCDVRQQGCQVDRFGDTQGLRRASKA